MVDMVVWWEWSDLKNGLGFDVNGRCPKRKRRPTRLSSLLAFISFFDIDNRWTGFLPAKVTMS